MLTMPISDAPVLSLTEEDRKRREALIRAGSTPQAFAFRARVVLRAADPDRRPICKSQAELPHRRAELLLLGIRQSGLVLPRVFFASRPPRR